MEFEFIRVKLIFLTFGSFRLTRLQILRIPLLVAPYGRLALTDKNPFVTDRRIPTHTFIISSVSAPVGMKPPSAKSSTFASTCQNGVPPYKSESGFPLFLRPGKRYRQPVFIFGIRQKDGYFFKKKKKQDLTAFENALKD